MDKEKLVSGIVGGIVAGFSIGVGFYLANKMTSRLGKKKTDETVSDAVKKGVQEGIKQNKVEEQAAQFAAMNASQGGRAKRQMIPQPQYIGFDGIEEGKGFSSNPADMLFSGDPMEFGQTPNSSNLNSY